MRVELYHASKYGNGAKVAEEFKRLMMAKGNEVNIHHIKEVSPKDLPSADLYVFGSPTHFGKAVGGMIRFLKKLSLPSGTKYAVFGTFSAARPNKKTGIIPSEEELEKERHTIPMIDEQLKAKGLRKVAEMKVFVQPENMKGPLEDGWQEIVEKFVAQILEPS
ncbi:MAG: flavodoxin family protein [Methanomassiliicoccales archaeon]|nr:flavodoxin family protein [Methanomassiliicoccales archaeon]NYT15403.1 flavodoxin family protein [Methanomassiliicoccales archaeon]